MIIAQTNNGVFGPLGSTARVGASRDLTSTNDAASPSTAAPDAPDKRSIQQAAVQSSKIDVAQLPPEAQTQVRELQQRDREVRTHEAAHMAAGGAYVRGGASYTYTAGPDGKRYAVGGEVGIDTSSIPDNPEATAAKMQVVRRAALAPAKPSSQDMAVAAKAAQAEIQARMEAAAKVREEREAEETEGVQDTDSAASPETAEQVTSSDREPQKAEAPEAGELLDFYA